MSCAHLAFRNRRRYTLDAGFIRQTDQATNFWLAEDQKLKVTADLYHRCNRLFEKMLEGHKSLTKEEIGQELNQRGFPIDNHGITRFLKHAGNRRTDLQRSGQKPKTELTPCWRTRTACPCPLSVEEALQNSHIIISKASPASLQDFIWWSGLSATEARQAIHSIRSELISDRYASQELFVHESCPGKTKPDETLHLLPSYDEYLLGYKDRSAVISPEHYAKAYNSWGIFYPVILYRGKLIGNWQKKGKGKGMKIETSFFESSALPAPELIQAAIERHKNFYL